MKPILDPAPAAAPRVSFLEGGGEMGALMRAHPWAETPLGSPEQWPQSLRSAVSILLPSRAQIVLFWGPDLITLYNDAYRPVLGDKHPRVLGLPARETWSEIWNTGLGMLFEGVLGTGEAFWARDRLFILERLGYPEETYFDVSYDPVRDETGNVGGIFCIVSETTGRVLGERRIRTLRNLAARTAHALSAEEVCRHSLASLADNPHDLPFALLYLRDSESHDPRFAGATPEVEALADPARWPLTEVGQGGIRLISLGSQPGLPTGAWSRPPERAVVLPVRGTGQDGVVGSLVAGLSPYRAFDEEYQGFLELIARELAMGLASAKAYEHERQRAEELARLDQAKTAFFSNISHEFRTPLTLMLGPLRELLARPADTPAADRHQLELAHRNAQRLLKLVNTLLDFSRIEAGRVEASYQATDLAAATADIASVFRSAIEAAGVGLVVDCMPLDQPVFVDRDMWEKIVGNLLSNAIKFTFDGVIEVTLRGEDGFAVVRIRDSGCGIPSEELPHLFERFYRARGTRGRTFEGSGIGLALVQELVRLHVGTIEADSTLNRGSCFTIRLPLGRSHLPPDRIVSSGPAVSPGPNSDAFLQELAGWFPSDSATDLPPAESSTRRARILLADDNADMREYLQRLLDDRYEVEAVPDGRAALSAAGERPPDLILTDIMMPRMGGLELLNHLRNDARLRFIPVILLSARAGEEARMEGLQLGADDYLVKPFGARELMTRIESRLELTRLRRQLQQEQADLAAIFTQTPVPTAVLRGPELVFELVNPAMVAAVGGKDIGGRPMLEALPEMQGQGFDRLMLDVMRSGRPHLGHEALIRLERDGRLQDTWWNFMFAPMRDADGRTDRVIAIGNDRTEEVLARVAIERSAERYRTIFQVAGVAIWEEDFSDVKRALDRLRANGVTDFRRYFAEHPAFVRECVRLVRIVDVNDATVRIYGASSKAELLESLDRVFVPETEPVFAEELLAIAERSTFFESEAQGRNLRGERMDVLFTMAFPPGDPELKSVLVSVMDITARKRAEQALRDADKRKDEFLATLSHELRNPLAPLRNSLHLLRLSSQSGGPAAPIHEMMERQVNHLVRLVDDLLEMSRISRDTFELRRERVPLRSIVQNAVETSDPLIQAAGHDLEVVVPSDPVWIEGDPVRLSQILSNLLNNAAKYTDQGGRIRIEARRDGVSAVISITDNGSGISAEALPRLFEMFSRGDRRTGRDQGGLGIGLALARRLVEMHGGTITADSAGPGRGSVFTVCLPLAPEQAGRSIPAEAAPPGIPRRRILVVDDNRDAAESLAMLLEFLGADVQIAFGGAAALDAVAQYDPAMILLDIGMPDMDGYEVAHRIRQQLTGRRPAIVALTGWGQEVDRAEARAAGFDHHLIKPADVAALQALLGTLAVVPS